MKLTGEEYDELLTLFKLGRKAFFENKEDIRKLLKLEDKLTTIITEHGYLQGTADKRTRGKKPN